MIALLGIGYDGIAFFLRLIVAVIKDLNPVYG